MDEDFYVWRVQKKRRRKKKKKKKKAIYPAIFHSRIKIHERTAISVVYESEESLDYKLANM